MYEVSDAQTERWRAGGVPKDVSQGVRFSEGGTPVFASLPAAAFKWRDETYSARAAALFEIERAQEDLRAFASAIAATSEEDASDEILRAFLFDVVIPHLDATATLLERLAGTTSPVEVVAASGALADTAESMSHYGAMLRTVGAKTMQVVDRVLRVGAFLKLLGEISDKV